MGKDRYSSQLEDWEKENLRNRILRSVQKEKRQKKALLPFLVAAASFALLFSLGYDFQGEPEPTLEDFVRTAPKLHIEKAEYVTLLLGNDTRVNLNEKNSSIHYSSSGMSVNIGSGKKITQQSDVKDKEVFNTIIVPYGKRTKLHLSDGSSVWLNSGSKLIFPAFFSGPTRSVFLKGEAIFDVAHNSKKPFKVISHSQEIEVLGTIFHVSSYAEDNVVETVLKSGSVSITYKKEGSKSVKLIPGTKASFNLKSAEITTSKVNVDNYFSWKEGFLTLEKSSLQKIMEKLSRYYNVEIVIEDRDLAMESFSGNLDLKEDVDEIIELIRQTSNFQIEKIKDKIVILKPDTMKK